MQHARKIIKSAWLIGEGRWGSRIKHALELLQITPKVIDIRHGRSIWDVDDLDPVIIATPTHLHFDHANHFIARGNHVLVEKPACETSDQIKKLISLRKHDQIVMPGHIYLFNELTEKLQGIIKSGQLGEIRFVHCERTNLGTYQNRKVLLNNIALHDITLLDHLWGISSIDMSRFIDLDDDGIPDRAVVLGTSGKINWQLDVSWLSAVRRRMLTVAGTRGQVVWDDDKKTLTVSLTDTSRGSLDYEKLNPISCQDDQPLINELRHFFDCCATGQEPIVSLEDSLRISEFISLADTQGTAFSTIPNH